jgi:hypothetical protein
MKFTREAFVSAVSNAAAKGAHAAFEIGKTVLGVALTAGCLAVVGGAVAAVAAVAEWSVIVKVILFVPAALGLLFLVMSLAAAFAKDDYSNKARLQRCAIGGVVCAAIPLGLAASMFSVAVPVAALTLFAIFMMATQFNYLEPMPLNRVLPVALGGDCETQAA